MSLENSMIKVAGREIRYIEIEFVLFSYTREDGLVLNSDIYYRLNNFTTWE
jgi:hypothetical protein